jgi:hypothetical protein
MVKKMKSPVKKTMPSGKKVLVKAVKKQVVSAPKAGVKKIVVTKPAVVLKAVAVPELKAAVKPVSAQVIKAETIVNDDHVFAMIQAKAYELFAARDYSAGSDLGDWYKAEDIVKKELRLN